MNGTEIVIAIALVALVLIFIRISWTLKEISDTLAARNSSEARVNADLGGIRTAEKTAAKEGEVDETEIAAVIAIASQAMRAAS